MDRSPLKNATALFAQRHGIACARLPIAEWLLGEGNMQHAQQLAQPPTGPALTADAGEQQQAEQPGQRQAVEDAAVPSEPAETTVQSTCKAGSGSSSSSRAGDPAAGQQLQAAGDAAAGQQPRQAPSCGSSPQPSSSSGGGSSKSSEAVPQPAGASAAAAGGAGPSRAAGAAKGQAQKESKESGGKDGKGFILNINDVVSILLAVHSGQGWGEALRAAIPQRKQAQQLGSGPAPVVPAVGAQEAEAQEARGEHDSADTS